MNKQIKQKSKFIRLVFQKIWLHRSLGTIKSYSHTKNQKNLMVDCQEMLENAYFSHLFRHFQPQKFTKLPMQHLKYYTSLVTYQKSEKSNDWLPSNARKRIFSTPFLPFLAQKCFFLQNFLCHIQLVYQARFIPKIRKIY